MRQIERLDAAMVRDRAEELAGLLRACWGGSYPYAPYTTARGWAEEIAPSIAAGRSESFAVLRNGKVVAHAAWVCDGSRREIGRWVVDPDTMHQGDMSALVARIASGLPRAFIGCSYYDAISCRIALRHGKITGVTPNVFDVTDGGMRRVWGEVIVSAGDTVVFDENQNTARVGRLVELLERFNAVTVQHKRTEPREATGRTGKWGYAPINCRQTQEACEREGLVPAAILPLVNGEWCVKYSPRSERPVVRVGIHGRHICDLPEGPLPICVPNSDAAGIVEAILSSL